MTPKAKNDVSLCDKIYRMLRKRIVSGKLKPHERIVESKISDSMRVSRAPVREALKRLAEDNLVKLIPRTGCFVSDVNNNEVEEIYEIRKRLECMALEYAWEKFSIPQVEDLRTQFENCANLSQPDILEKEIQLDSQLHRLIIKTSGCKIIEIMIEKLLARVEVFRISQAADLDRAIHARKDHINILSAIIARNKDMAIHNLSNHIENTKQRIMKTASRACSGGETGL